MHVLDCGLKLLDISSHFSHFLSRRVILTSGYRRSLHCQKQLTSFFLSLDLVFYDPLLYWAGRLSRHSLDFFYCHLSSSLHRFQFQVLDLLETHASKDCLFELSWIHWLIYCRFPLSYTSNLIWFNSLKLSPRWVQTAFRCLIVNNSLSLLQELLFGIFCDRLWVSFGLRPHNFDHWKCSAIALFPLRIGDNIIAKYNKCIVWSDHFLLAVFDDSFNTIDESCRSRFVYHSRIIEGHRICAVQRTPMISVFTPKWFFGRIAHWSVHNSWFIHPIVFVKRFTQ